MCDRCKSLSETDLAQIGREQVERTQIALPKGAAVDQEAVASVAQLIFRDRIAVIPAEYHGESATVIGAFQPDGSVSPVAVLLRPAVSEHLTFDGPAAVRQRPKLHTGLYL